jgi:enoyl-CoA hydratase
VPSVELRDIGRDLRIITLNRPSKRNALTTPIVERLTQALEQTEGEPHVRGVILAGVGPSFCAGVDLHEFADGSPESIEGLIRALARLCRTTRTMRKPVAAAIQGHCLGGALELAACCDLRICTPEAQFGMPEVWLGIPSVIDAVMLPVVIGVGRAHELMLTGDSIDAPTAYAWGLVGAVVPPHELVERTAAALRRITRHDPDVVAAQKRLHQQWLEISYSRAVEFSIGALLDAFRAGRPQRIAAERLRTRQNQPDPGHPEQGAKHEQ